MAVRRRRSTFVKQVLVVFDTVVSAIAFIIALTVRERLSTLEAGIFGQVELPPVNDSLEAYYLMLVGLIPIWALSLRYAKTGDLRISLRAAAGRYAKAVVLSIGLFILLAFLLKVDFLARTFVLMLGVIQYTTLLLSRVITVYAADAWRRRDEDGHRVAIVGAGAASVEFVNKLLERSPIPIKILGYVRVPGEEEVEAAKPDLGSVKELARLLDEVAIDEVAFAVPGKQPETFRDAIAACDERGVDVVVSLPPQFPASAKMEIANVTGFDMPMLGLRRTPTGELRLAVKRVIDLTGALVGVALASPVMLFTALAIKLEDGGPIFFKQVRAGRHGRKFAMLKFRSMVTDAEKLKQQLLAQNEMDGPVFKMKHDPRITRVGRIIRKTSVDELPQFFNIIMGDMSIVGPRPPLPSEVEQYEPWQRRRLSVKPGLTGLWQVSGRNQVDFDEWMQLDLEYIDKWSLWMDLKIIVRTVPAVLFQRGSS